MQAAGVLLNTQGMTWLTPLKARRNGSHVTRAEFIQYLVQGPVQHRGGCAVSGWQMPQIALRAFCGIGGWLPGSFSRDLSSLTVTVLISNFRSTYAQTHAQAK